MPQYLFFVGENIVGLKVDDNEQHSKLFQSLKCESIYSFPRALR